MFRSDWDVLKRLTANFIVSLNGTFVNRLVTSKETKLTRSSSSTNAKVLMHSIAHEDNFREDYMS